MQENFILFAEKCTARSIGYWSSDHLTTMGKDINYWLYTSILCKELRMRKSDSF